MKHLYPLRKTHSCWVYITGLAFLALSLVLSLGDTNVSYADDGDHNHKPKKSDNHDHGTQPAPNQHEDVQHVGICHRTGSNSVPFVFMVVDEDAVAAHRAHGDIIGVSSQHDCPGPESIHDDHGNSAPNAEEHPEVLHQVGICHSTGSSDNPFVFITVDANAVEAHRAHGDLIDVHSQAECAALTPDHHSSSMQQPPLSGAEINPSTAQITSSVLGISVGKASATSR